MHASTLRCGMNGHEWQEWYFRRRSKQYLITEPRTMQSEYYLVSMIDRLKTIVHDAIRQRHIQEAIQIVMRVFHGVSSAH